MTPLSSILHTRSTRAAVVLAAVLHAAVLFGFAQYDHTRSSMGHRQTAPDDYQPVAVIFVAAQEPSQSAAPAQVSMPVLASRPVPLVDNKLTPDPPTQPTSTVQEALSRAQLGPQDLQDSAPPAPTIAGPEEATPVTQPAHPIQAAKPDYAYNPQPDYPLLLREQGVGGVVWLRVWVDSEGLPGEIKLAKGSGYRLLDDAALRAVRQWRFTPAKKGNSNLASWVEFPIRFALNG